MEERLATIKLNCLRKATLSVLLTFPKICFFLAFLHNDEKGFWYLSLFCWCHATIFWWLFWGCVKNFLLHFCNQSWKAILLLSEARLDFESREFMIESHAINTVLHTVCQIFHRFSRWKVHRLHIVNMLLNMIMSTNHAAEWYLISDHTHLLHIA